MPESLTTVSPLPRALLRSPRIVRRKRGTLGLILMGRILTVPALAFIALFVTFVVLEPVVVFLLPARPARVVALREQYQRRSGDVCYVSYKFDRMGIVGCDEVLLNEYRAFQVGQTIKAHVIRLGPLSYSVLDRTPANYARYRMILWFGASFALVIGWMLYHAAWHSPRRAHWLVRRGHATFGAVVSKSVYQGMRRQVSFTLTYQFKAAGSLQARCIRISPQRYDAAAITDLVVVLFDPKRPGRNIVYDYCDFVALRTPENPEMSN